MLQLHDIVIKHVENLLAKWLRSIFEISVLRLFHGHVKYISVIIIIIIINIPESKSVRTICYINYSSSLNEPEVLIYRLNSFKL
jgi:hypothetical protein